MVTNPVPTVASLLLLTFPGLLLLGWSLARRATNDRSYARIITPALALACWILALHVAGRLTGSFHSAIWIGTLVPAALGLVLHLRVRPRRDLVATNPPPSKWMWGGAVGTMLVITPIAFGWAFHDELMFSGHMSIAASIQNGPYPPRSLSLPTHELRYHYAFALIVAAVTSIVRTPLHLGIDLVTVPSAGYLFVLLWTLGDRLLGHGKGWITALLTFYGAGVPFVCAASSDGVARSLLAACGLGTLRINPSIVSYVFQHPWTLGLPIAAVVIMLAVDEDGGRARLPVIALLLSALSFTQVALFAALSASIVVSEAMWRGFSLRRGAAMLAVSVFAWIAAIAMGGFFAPAPEGAVSLEPTLGVAGDPIASLAWNAASFGLLLPFGLLGLRKSGPSKWLLACLAIGGLVIVNSVRYTHSWDMVKFAAVAAIGMSIAASAGVAHILSTQPRFKAKLLAGIAVIGITAGGFSFVSAFALNVEGIPDDIFHKRPSAYTRDEANAMNWLRRNARPGEVVYRNSGWVMSYSQWAGLPQPWHDPMLDLFGGAPRQQDERMEELLAALPDDPAEFAERNIVWFVILDDESRSAQLARTWIRQDRAVERMRFGSLRVIELVRMPSSS